MNEEDCRRSHVGCLVSELLLVQLREHSQLLLHRIASLSIGDKGEVYAMPFLVDEVMPIASYSSYTNTTL